MHSKRKDGVRRGVRAGVLLLAAICAATFVIHYLISRPRVASFAEITTELGLLKQSPGYRRGERALIEAQQGAAVTHDTVDNYCVGLYLRVDFVGTLSAPQFDLMRERGGLPFTSLTDSQKALLHEPGPFGHAGVRNGVNDSDLPRAALAVMYQPHYYYLRWICTGSDGSRSDIEYGLVDGAEDIKRGMAMEEEDARRHAASERQSGHR